MVSEKLLRVVREAASKIIEMLPEKRKHKLYDRDIHEQYTFPFNKDYYLSLYNEHEPSGSAPHLTLCSAKAGVRAKALSFVWNSSDYKELTLEEIKLFLEKVKTGQLEAQLKEMIAETLANEEDAIKSDAEAKAKQQAEEEALLSYWNSKKPVKEKVKTNRVCPRCKGSGKA